MKDKLTRTGHKKLYYRLKSLAIISAVFTAGVAAIVSPVMITYTIAQQEAAAAAAKANGKNEEVPTITYFEK